MKTRAGSYDASAQAPSRSLCACIAGRISLFVMAFVILLFILLVMFAHVSAWFLLTIPILCVAIFFICHAIVQSCTINLEEAIECVKDYAEDNEFDLPRSQCTEARILGEALTKIQRNQKDTKAEVVAEDTRRGQFISDVSHEMRTPLTAIRGTAETLLDKDIPEDMRERFLGTIISESERLTRLANDLITLQRLESTDADVEFTRIDVRPIAEDVVAMLTPILEEKNLTCDITGEAPDIMGESDRLHQVFINLIANATRFATSHISVNLAGIKGQTIIAVIDDGPGFGDVDPARLFDRFYRADQSRDRNSGGSGLGLSIVKTVANSLGGTVEAFNTKTGACFIVAIPSCPPK